MFQSKKLDVSSRFELDRHSFSGTMSNFHLAKEIATGKTFGLKFLDVEKLEFFENRFKGMKKPTEGEIGMQMNHPRLVKTFEYGQTTTNQPYILMEFIAGQGLNTVIQENPKLLDGHRLDLFRQMAEAIHAVHTAGYIHRDICPRNFIVAPDGKSLKLIDFGLTVPDKPEFRAPGNRTGTPLYMAPEIARRRPTDKRVDIFALGVTAYRLFSGEHPWSSGADTSGKAALAHDTHKPRDIREYVANLDRRIADIIMKCIDSNRENRPEGADAVLRTLKQIDLKV